MHDHFKGICKKLSEANNSTIIKISCITAKSVDKLLLKNYKVKTKLFNLLYESRK